jgi:hypothetical protein
LRGLLSACSVLEETDAGKAIRCIDEVVANQAIDAKET